MPQLRRRELESIIIAPMKSKASAKWIQQLKTLNICGKVAHFGCASGSETLALVWVLDACEAYGIDRDISQAARMLKGLREWITESRHALSYASPENYLWWKNTVPSFLKEERFPTFIREPDIAHPVRPFQLPCGYFDLACCSNLLCQILENQGEGDVKSAIEEMKRVVKLEGWIVADEPDNSTPARFSSILERAKLEQFKVTTCRIVGRMHTTTYYYRKFQE